MRGGSDLLVPQWQIRVSHQAREAIPKILITSVDYGLTEPEALTFWSQQPNTRVAVRVGTRRGPVASIYSSQAATRWYERSKPPSLSEHRTAPSAVGLADSLLSDRFPSP